MSGAAASSRAQAARTNSSRVRSPPTVSASLAPALANASIADTRTDDVAWSSVVTWSRGASAQHDGSRRISDATADNSATKLRVDCAPLGLIRFGGQCDYAANLILAALSNSAGLA